MKWVIDASVAAKWLAPEADSPAAEAMLDEELLAPDLLYVEVANILWKKRMRGEIAATTVSAAVRWLLQVPLQVHDGMGLLVDAVDLAQRLKHPAYDCFYLALAVRNDIALVTADRLLFDRSRQAGVAALADRVRLLSARRGRL
jgi:predicted nucleic acid-binding protein